MRSRNQSRSLYGCALALCASLLLLPAQRSGRAGGEADEYRLLPVRIHLLRAARVPELNCGLQETDARRILEKVNRIWNQARLQFYPESILSEEAAAQPIYSSLGSNRTEAHLALIRPRLSRSERMFHLYFLHAMRPNGITLDGSYQCIFVKDTASLRPVPGGIDEPLPRVSAHEIGHGLGLEHRQDRTNLMASGTTGTSLNDPEIRLARRTAESFPWRLTPDEALALAGKLEAARAASARDLYAVLAKLPPGAVSAAARVKVAGAGQ